MVMADFLHIICMYNSCIMYTQTYLYSRRHINGDVSIPYSSVPFTFQFPFHMRKQSMNTLGVSYQYVKITGGL